MTTSLTRSTSWLMALMAAPAWSASCTPLPALFTASEMPEMALSLLDFISFMVTLISSVA